MGWRNLNSYVPFIIGARQKAFGVAKFFCFLHVTNTYLISPGVCKGRSMLPTIEDSGNLFFIERISPQFGKVACGDIVFSRCVDYPTMLITKRVIGMEGDSITYIPFPGNNDKHETIVVPKGHVWLQGDNADFSTDSRYFGPVPYGLILAKMFWRVTPLKDFGPFRNK